MPPAPETPNTCAALAARWIGVSPFCSSDMPASERVVRRIAAPVTLMAMSAANAHPASVAHGACAARFSSFRFAHDARAP